MVSLTPHLLARRGKSTAPHRRRVRRCAPRLRFGCRSRPKAHRAILSMSSTFRRPYDRRPNRMHHISTRELDIEIATFRLCGNLRIKAWTNTPSPDGSPIPPPQKTNDDEDESSKPLDCLLMEAPKRSQQSPLAYRPAVVLPLHCVPHQESAPRANPTLRR